MLDATLESALITLAFMWFDPFLLLVVIAASIDEFGVTRIEWKLNLKSSVFDAIVNQTHHYQGPCCCYSLRLAYCCCVHVNSMLNRECRLKAIHILDTISSSLNLEREHLLNNVLDFSKKILIFGFAFCFGRGR